MHKSAIFSAATAGTLLPFLAHSYVMPISAHDLALNQRYSTVVHAAGIQAEGKDIGARRHKSDDEWSSLTSDDADKKVLGNWVVYNKPFYAMAAGTVVGCWRNAPDNTPGSLHADFTAKKFAGGGNHLWILQDDGVHALYAHASPGSIPAAICPHHATLFTGKNGNGGSPDIEAEVKVIKGARVLAGQLLGRIGNSGASSGGPHLHVHMEKAGTAVVMNFEHGLTTPFAGGKGRYKGPWTKLAGNALPKAGILIWAPRPVGNYTFNNASGAAFQGLFDHMSDSGMMPDTITCKSNGKTYNSIWAPARGSWFAHHGMSAGDAAAKHATYTGQGYTRSSSYTCGSVSVAVWRK